MTNGSDIAILTFEAKTRVVEYGDKKRFHEYLIEILKHGRVVGLEAGPRRTSRTEAAALRDAQARINELRSHRLYVVRVKNKHIEEGRRDCYNCAIALAIRENLNRMGLKDYQLRFAPYASFVDAEGLELTYDGFEWRRGDETDKPSDLALTPENLPDVVTHGKRDGLAIHYHDGMVEWAQNFDEWDDKRGISIAEWREQRGYDDGEWPFKPSPCSFVLDLDAMAQG